MRAGFQDQSGINNDDGLEIDVKQLQDAKRLLAQSSKKLLFWYSNRRSITLEKGEMY